MDMQTLDIILTIGALVVGIMLLTGNGAVFMKGGNDAARSKVYDEKKMEKVYGISMILIGLATGINMFMTGFVAQIVYIVVLLIILVGMVVLVKTKCKK